MHLDFQFLNVRSQLRTSASVLSYFEVCTVRKFIADRRADLASFKNLAISDSCLRDTIATCERSPRTQRPLWFKSVACVRFFCEKLVEADPFVLTLGNQSNNMENR